MPLISCDSITKTYESEGVVTDVLRGISLTIEKGEFVSIIGPSGSGKSTLMHILGLLETPTNGVYTFSGKNILDLTEQEIAYVRNQNIGFVFQAFNLLSRTSVFENVELPLLYDIYGDAQIKGDKKISFTEKMKHFFALSGGTSHKEKVQKALLSVGMEHRISYRPNQLSGGEKQRVAIARALVNNPEIIFADEPTGNLDSKSGLQVMQILQKLNTEGHTIVLVTHETYTAEHAKRIIRIRDGRIEADETVSQWRDASRERILK